MLELHELERARNNVEQRDVCTTYYCSDRNQVFVANGAVKAFTRFDTGLWRYPEERREACLRVKIDRKGPIAMQGEVLR